MTVDERSMTPGEIAEASRMLLEHWRNGTKLDALPAELRPADRRQGYAIQELLEAATDQPLYGWKIAATSIAGQAHIGVDGPLAGRLLAERVVENGGTCALGGNRMLVAELEFAFRMGADLTPRNSPYSVDEVLEHVASLHPAIEIPDARYVHFETVGAPQLIADNACADQFLLGQPAPESWRTIDLSAHQVRGQINGGEWHHGVGANVLGDPRIALAWLANELSSLCITLTSGSVVTTGTCVVPITIDAGDTVLGDFGTLGTVSVQFAA